MCKKKQFKYCPSRIDNCMKPLITFLNKGGFKTVACCCGHRKYPMTIIIKLTGTIRPRYQELLTITNIERTRRFYKKDKQGYYFIPEVK